MGHSSQIITLSTQRGREYRIKKLLSDAGRFGQIYVAEDGADPTRHYAVKVLALTSESKKAIQRESTIMVCLFYLSHLFMESSPNDGTHSNNLRDTRTS